MLSLGFIIEPLAYRGQIKVLLDTAAAIRPIDVIQKRWVHYGSSISHSREAESASAIWTGIGVIDIASIVKVANEADSEGLIVEMDSCPRPSLESAKICIDNLKRMNLI